MSNILLTASVIALASPAMASTPQSWAQLNKRVNRACVAMSGLDRPELLAQKISFSDTFGMESRMIRGKDDRGRMQRKLCLYSRKSGRAEVQDAPAWNGETTRP